MDNHLKSYKKFIYIYSHFLTQILLGKIHVSFFNKNKNERAIEYSFDLVSNIPSVIFY